MEIQCIMHVPFEGPAVIADWAKEKGHKMNRIRLFEKDPLPDPGRCDLLVIMGGPMNVFDYHIHPWMEEEIEWVEGYLASGKPALGICLGAQIIAAALGSEVFPGKQKEIGWFDLHFLPALGQFRICPELPSTRKVFHWHGDTFEIPPGAVRIAETRTFPNQGFIYNDRVAALQFHLEMTPEAVSGMVENCGDELADGPTIQNAREILGETRFFTQNQELMYRFLDYLESFAAGAASGR